MKFKHTKRTEAEEVNASHYPADGSPAWWVGDGDGPDYIKLTVCAIDLGFDPPATGYAYVKDWNEGAGVAEAMAEQGLVEVVTRIDINGHGSKLAIVRVLS